MAGKHEKILIGAVLKEERLRQGYTREQMAECAEIGVKYLIAIENDEKKPRFEVLYRLVRGLGMSADQLFYPERTDQENQDNKRIQRLFQYLGSRDQKLLFAMVDTMIDVREKQDDES